jgi:hypothetical protein
MISGGVYRHYDHTPVVIRQRRRLVSIRLNKALADIAVTGNSVNISDGSAAPSTTDHTDFGAIILGAGTVSRTYTVYNRGLATLSISSATVPTGYTVTTALPGTIAPGITAPLIVRLDDAVLGTKAGDVTINTNDPGQPAFNFAISGIVSQPASSGVAKNRLSYPFTTFGSPF